MNRKFVFATLIAASLGSAAAAAPFSSAVASYSSLLTQLESEPTETQQAAVDRAQLLLETKNSTKFSTDLANIQKADAIVSKAFPMDTSYRQQADTTIAGVAFLGGASLPNLANLAAANRFGTSLATARIITKVGKLADRVDVNKNGTGFEAADVSANRKKFFKTSLALYRYCEGIIKRYGGTS